MGKHFVAVLVLAITGGGCGSGFSVKEGPSPIPTLSPQPIPSTVPSGQPSPQPSICGHAHVPAGKGQHWFVLNDHAEVYVGANTSPDEFFLVNEDGNSCKVKYTSADDSVSEE